MVRQNLPQYEGIHLRGRHDFMDFFVLLPPLMEGKKPNPAQGREIPFPPPKGDCAFCLSSGKAKNILLILSKVFLVNAGNGRTFSILTPQDGMDELRVRVNPICL
jgi:hypothetical protein